MDLKEIHSASVNFIQDLIPKSCRITYPNNSNNKLLRNYKFDIPQITTGRLTSEHMDRMNYTNSKNCIRITIRVDLLQATLDTTSTYSIPIGGFKDSSTEITYRKRKYVVFMEEYGEMDSTIELYCESLT